jgi:hypothetical protein
VEIQEETPSLNRSAIKAMWDRCFKQAKKDAEGEMNQKSTIEKLTWAQVFEQEYDLNGKNGKQ